MSEFAPNREIEPSDAERISKLLRLAKEAGFIEDADVEYLGEDLDEIIGNLYGVILENGEDPDDHLASWGFLESDGETE